MTDKELAEKYRREFKELLDEIKEREDERKKIKIVIAVHLSAKEEKEEEEEEKEFDFVEDYLSRTTDPLLRWYRDYRKGKNDKAIRKDD